MRKVLILVMMSLLMTLIFASSAVALEPYYHGDFDTNSVGCAKCHVTHAGSAKALLIAGPTQTDFCNYCHSDISKSPYGVLDGKIQTDLEVWPSLAGGFDSSFDFDTKNYDATDGANPANYIASDSVHGVESFDSDDWVLGAQIPGGTNTLVGNFRCGSCHDPHAGGTYPAAGVMPRLLKASLYGTDFVVADFQDWTFSAETASFGTDMRAKVLTGYGDEAGNWCAGCHDLFNQTAHDAGQVAVNNASTGNADKYMHRMNFTVNAANVNDITNASLEKLALSVGGDLTCLTCHRAHGTASTVTAGTVFNRAWNYLHGDGTAESGTQESSVLLREKERDVCFDCHGAAEFNKPSQQE